MSSSLSESDEVDIVSESCNRSLLVKIDVAKEIFGIFLLGGFYENWSCWLRIHEIQNSISGRGLTGPYLPVRSIVSVCVDMQILPTHLN